MAGQVISWDAVNKLFAEEWERLKQRLDRSDPMSDLYIIQLAQCRMLEDLWQQVGRLTRDGTRDGEVE